MYESAQDFKSLAEMLSTPVDFLTFKCDIILNTSDSETGLKENVCSWLELCFKILLILG